ncbi:MAG: DUF58 domain-containing protein [Chloroflexia bacterium]|nr:DUF58 domain-containing protein [Chloroflexia bacterium]
MLTIIVFFMAQGTGNETLFNLFYILAGLLVVSYLWARLSMRGLTAWRDLRTSRAQVGKQVVQRLLVRNESVWPKLWLELTDLSDLPGHWARFVTSIPPRERRRLWARTRCSMRGKYTLGPIVIRTGDPLGLFHFQQRLPDMVDLVVYPATEEIHGFELLPAELPGGIATRQRTHQTTPNVSGVRDYVPGDSYNRIHWRSTARHRRLVVKEFELDPTADVWMILDMERRAQRSEIYKGAPPSVDEDLRSPESTEEYLVTATASLAGYFILQQRRNTGLISWGQHREVLPPEREPRQFYRMMECLAILRAHGDAPLAEVLAADSNRFSRNTSLVILTCSSDPGWVQAGLRDLLYKGINAVVVLVDGLTFGGWQELGGVEAELMVHRVPYYVIRQGDPIGLALSGVVAKIEWQRGALYAGVQSSLY